MPTPPAFLQPFARAQPDDVDQDGDPQRAERHRQYIGPTITQPAPTFPEDKSRDNRRRNQQVRVIEDVIDPVAPAAQKPMTFTQGALRPADTAPFGNRDDNSITANPCGMKEETAATNHISKDPGLNLAVGPRCLRLRTATRLNRIRSRSLRTCTRYGVVCVVSVVINLQKGRK